MAGIRFTIARGSTVVAEGVATGTESAVCTSSLEPGSYQVAQILPDALEMTTAGNTLIDVGQGQEIGLEFGSRVRQAAPPTATTAAVAQVDTGSNGNGAGGGGNDQSPSVDSSNTDAGSGSNSASAPDDSGSGLGLIEMVIIGVMVLAVIMLGAVVFLLLRQQRQ